MPRQSSNKVMLQPAQLAYLCLYGIEGAELLVEALKGLVAQRTDRQRLQVQQLSGGWVLLRQDQLPGSRHAGDHTGTHTHRGERSAKVRHEAGTSICVGEVSRVVQRCVLT